MLRKNDFMEGNTNRQVDVDWFIFVIFGGFMKVIFVFMFLQASLFADVIVNKIKGDVEFVSFDGKVISIKEKDFLEPGTTIKTSSKSEVELLYDDGIMIFLWENSRFTVGGVKENKTAFLPFNPFILSLNASEKESWWDYLYGKAMFFIKKYSNEYNVRTPTAVLGVRGTNFSVVCDSDTSEVGLFKGIVEIEKDGKKVVLKPGQSAIITRQDLIIKERLSSLMEKEKKRAEKLEKYFERVSEKLLERDKRIKEKIKSLNSTQKDIYKSTSNRLDE